MVASVLWSSDVLPRVAVAQDLGLSNLAMPGTDWARPDLGMVSLRCKHGLAVYYVRYASITSATILTLLVRLYH